MSAAAPRVHRCLACNLAAGPGDRFCEGCGTRLPAACPACAALLRPGKPFCHQCGRPIDSVVPPVVPAAPAAAPKPKPEPQPPPPSRAPKTPSIPLPRTSWAEEPASQHRTIAYARFLRRFSVVLLDGLWLMPLALGLRWALFTFLDQRIGIVDERFWDIFSRPAESERFFLQIAGASLLTVTFFIARGATPGMRLTRVRAIDRNGLPPGIVRALARSIIPALFLVPYIDPDWLPLTSFVGFLYFVSCFTVGFSQRAQTLHDMLAGVYIVERSPGPNGF